jgi:hypothetical protein
MCRTYHECLYPAPPVQQPRSRRAAPLLDQKGATAISVNETQVSGVGAFFGQEEDVLDARQFGREADDPLA